MNTSKVINVATDFSKYPAGRYKKDGPFTGEQFRDDYLVPALENYTSVIVELDGTLGYGSSFLEEAFGGLIRRGYNPTLLKKKLQLKTTMRSIHEEINQYIQGGQK